MSSMDRSRILAALAYIPFGFLLLLAAGDGDDFHRFHTRQGMAVTFLSLLIIVGAGFLAIFTPFFIGILLAFALDTMVAFLLITAAWQAYLGQTWEMPIIGAYARVVKS